jgi:hypothetical protein
VRITGTCYIKAYFENADPHEQHFRGSMPLAAFLRRFRQIG